MYKVIELFDDSGNVINVPMKSNAGTAIRYKSIFHKDIPITADKDMLLVSIMKDMGIDLDNDSDLMNISQIMDNVARTIQELAFVMAMSAKGEKMDELNQSMFTEWIEGLDVQSFSEEKQDEIWSVYSGSVKNSSNAKKKSARQAAK